MIFPSRKLALAEEGCCREAFYPKRREWGQTENAFEPIIKCLTFYGLFVLMLVVAPIETLYLVLWAKQYHEAKFPIPKGKKCYSEYFNWTYLRKQTYLGLLSFAPYILLTTPSHTYYGNVPFVSGERLVEPPPDRLINRVSEKFSSLNL